MAAGPEDDPGGACLLIVLVMAVPALIIGIGYGVGFVIDLLFGTHIVDALKNS